MYSQVTPQYITANFQLASSFFNCSVTVVFLTPSSSPLCKAIFKFNMFPKNTVQIMPES